MRPCGRVPQQQAIGCYVDTCAAGVTLAAVGLVTEDNLGYPALPIRTRVLNIRSTFIVTYRKYYFNYHLWN